jgi:hypothetical protein
VVPATFYGNDYYVVSTTGYYHCEDEQHNYVSFFYNSKRLPRLYEVESEQECLDAVKEFSEASGVKFEFQSAEFGLNHFENCFGCNVLQQLDGSGSRVSYTYSYDYNEDLPVMAWYCDHNKVSEEDLKSGQGRILPSSTVFPNFARSHGPFHICIAKPVYNPLPSLEVWISDSPSFFGDRAVVKIEPTYDLTTVFKTAVESSVGRYVSLRTYESGTKLRFESFTVYGSSASTVSGRRLSTTTTNTNTTTTTAAASAAATTFFNRNANATKTRNDSDEIYGNNATNATTTHTHTNATVVVVYAATEQNQHDYQIYPMTIDRSIAAATMTTAMPMMMENAVVSVVSVVSVVRVVASAATSATGTATGTAATTTAYGKILKSMCELIEAQAFSKTCTSASVVRRAPPTMNAFLRSILVRTGVVVTEPNNDDGDNDDGALVVSLDNTMLYDGKLFATVVFALIFEPAVAAIVFELLSCLSPDLCEPLCTACPLTHRSTSTSPLSATDVVQSVEAALCDSSIGSPNCVQSYDCLRDVATAVAVAYGAAQAADVGVELVEPVATLNAEFVRAVVDAERFAKPPLQRVNARKRVISDFARKQQALRERMRDESKRVPSWKKLESTHASMQSPSPPLPSPSPPPPESSHVTESEATALEITSQSNITCSLLAKNDYENATASHERVLALWMKFQRYTFESAQTIHDDHDHNAPNQHHLCVDCQSSGGRSTTSCESHILLTARSLKAMREAKALKSRVHASRKLREEHVRAHVQNTLENSCCARFHSTGKIECGKKYCVAHALKHAKIRAAHTARRRLQSTLRNKDTNNNQKPASPIAARVAIDLLDPASHPSPSCRNTNKSSTSSDYTGCMLQSILNAVKDHHDIDITRFDDFLARFGAQSGEQLQSIARSLGLTSTKSDLKDTLGRGKQKCCTSTQSGTSMSQGLKHIGVNKIARHLSKA